jgi:hypothetical protein
LEKQDRKILLFLCVQSKRRRKNGEYKNVPLRQTTPGKYLIFLFQQFSTGVSKIIIERRVAEKNGKYKKKSSSWRDKPREKKKLFSVQKLGTGVCKTFRAS